MSIFRKLVHAVAAPLEKGAKDIWHGIDKTFGHGSKEILKLLPQAALAYETKGASLGAGFMPGEKSTGSDQQAPWWQSVLDVAERYLGQPKMPSAGGGPGTIVIQTGPGEAPDASGEYAFASQLGHAVAKQAARSAIDFGGLSGIGGAWPMVGMAGMTRAVGAGQALRRMGAALMRVPNVGAKATGAGLLIAAPFASDIKRGIHEFFMGPKVPKTKPPTELELERDKFELMKLKAQEAAFQAGPSTADQALDALKKQNEMLEAVVRNAALNKQLLGPKKTAPHVPTPLEQVQGELAIARAKAELQAIKEGPSKAKAEADAKAQKEADEKFEKAQKETLARQEAAAQHALDVRERRLDLAGRALTQLLSKQPRERGRQVIFAAPAAREQRTVRLTRPRKSAPSKRRTGSARTRPLVVGKGNTLGQVWFHYA